MVSSMCNVYINPDPESKVPRLCSACVCKRITCVCNPCLSFMDYENARETLHALKCTTTTCTTTSPRLFQTVYL